MCGFFEDGEVEGYVLVLVETQERWDVHKERRVMLVEKCEEVAHGFVEIRPEMPFWGQVGFWLDGIRTERNHDLHLACQVCPDQGCLDVCCCSNYKWMKLVTITLQEWLISDSNIPVNSSLSWYRVNEKEIPKPNQSSYQNNKKQIKNGWLCSL